MESFLKDPTFSSEKNSSEISSFPMSGRSEDNPKATIGRLADVMSHGYNIDTLVPILEAYQGSRALEGNLPAAEILSDIHGYLAAKATRSTPEDVKPRDIEPAMGQ